MMNSNKQEMKFKREKKETWKVLLTKATAQAKLCKEMFGAALPGRKTDPASKRVSGILCGKLQCIYTGITIIRYDGRCNSHQPRYMYVTSIHVHHGIFRK